MLLFYFFIHYRDYSIIMEGTDWLGLHVEHLEFHQVVFRALIVFMISQICIRIAGFRIFSKANPVDSIVVLMMGAILGRSVVVAQPFLESMSAVVILVFLHRFVAYISFKNKTLGSLFKGDKVLLYQNGNFIYENMVQVRVTENDIMESIRNSLNKNNLHSIKEIYLERSGRISIVSV